MNTIKLKVTEGSHGVATLQNPAAPIGLNRRVCTYQVTEIPGGTPTSKVVQLFNGTTIMPMTCFSVPFSQCGIGRIYIAR